MYDYENFEFIFSRVKSHPDLLHSYYLEGNFLWGSPLVKSLQNKDTGTEQVRMKGKGNSSRILKIASTITQDLTAKCVFQGSSSLQVLGAPEPLNRKAVDVCQVCSTGISLNFLTLSIMGVRYFLRSGKYKNTQ